MASGEFDVTLAAAKRGDASGLARLYANYRPAVLQFFRGQDPAEAEDLTSDVFVSVARSLGRFRGDEPGFRSWLFTIAHRRLTDHRRRRARRPSEPLPPEHLVRHGTQGDAEWDAMSVVGTTTAISRIASLPSAQAEVLLLRVVADLSVTEVSRIVGRNPPAVRALQYRALRRLAGEFELAREGAL
ncbi:MAG: RNA polymerase sigma factor [Acidimicrobiaceae bacterium]|nr:RNA polymerase sigma factor [Acidimicrobiaceae bacterium]